MNNQPKVSAQDLMTVVISTNKAAGAAVKISGENSKSIAELTKKVDALQASVSQSDKPQDKPVSKGAAAFMILLMLIGAAIVVCSFVPQVAEYLSFMTANIWRWVHIGYAMIAVLAVAVANVKTPIKVLSVLFAIAPMAISLALSIL